MLLSLLPVAFLHSIKIICCCSLKQLLHFISGHYASKVRENGVAYGAGLREGNRIVQINGVEIDQVSFDTMWRFNSKTSIFGWLISRAKQSSILLFIKRFLKQCNL